MAMFTYRFFCVRAAALKLLGILIAVFGQPSLADSTPLTLERAVTLAFEADPWLDGSQQIQLALMEEAIALDSLPDPQLSLLAQNVPTSYDVNQENMTQMAVAVSQQFPRGRSRALGRQQKEAMAAMEPMRRAERRASVRASVSDLFLDAYLAQASRSLIEEDRTLFSQLVDAAEAQYTSATGRARQQDLIRAQLELIRLDDRLTVLAQKQEVAQQQLAQLTPRAADLPVDSDLPDLMTDRAEQLLAGRNTPAALYVQLENHPAVLAADRSIDSVALGVDLARQKYRPGFGLRAQYGYRAEDSDGRSRDDLISLGLTFDLPIFHRNRQDRQVSAAVAREAAARADRSLLVRELVSRLEANRAELVRLNQRRALYQERLLPQMAQQSDASLAAYNHADGDFAEAVRARIAELDAKIDALAINVAREQTLSRINYLLTRSDPSVALAARTEGAGNE
jgi:outer membrane protein TolC